MLLPLEFIASTVMPGSIPVSFSLVPLAKVAILEEVENVATVILTSYASVNTGIID